MNKKSIVLVAVIFAALTFFPSSAMAAENLITNGSFEVGGGEGSLIVGYAGGSTFPGWNVTLGGIERIENTFWQASDGSWSLDMNGTNYNGGIQQGFSTIPGGQYLVNFDMAGNADSVWGPLYTMGVSAAGQSQIFSFDRTGHDRSAMGWVSNSFQFTANSIWTTLDFSSTCPITNEYAAGGPALDNVFVRTVTPEPVSSALFLLGGLALSARKLLRKRS